MTDANFKFISDAQGGDRFTVISFSAQEGLSQLYRYEIEIKAPVTEEIDLDEVLDAHARFVTELNGVEHPVHGVLSSFEETRFAQNYGYYRAVLVPRLWKLSNYRTNEIFYQAGIDGEAEAGQGIDKIIDQLLSKAGLDSSEYDLTGLTGNLLKREYRCQYNESDFDFISRLMENEGVFYYFEQGDLAETIVFINDMNYMDLPQPRLLFDVAAQSSRQDDCVYAWSCRKQRLPHNVIVRDYNPDEPSLDVSDITDIDSMGQGTEYIYGKNVKSDTEATYLSQIRAEEYICRKTQFFGESSVTRLRAGHLFAVDGHPNDKYSGVEYLPIEVQHEGASLDMSLGGGRDDAQPQYRNSFIAIPAEVQYRPPRLTPRPRITGTLHAVIDGELDSEYAQLDEQGRYKVSLPFDFHNEEHPEGLASARVRMMQPYAGKHRGMQFPMAKGTEVLLSFVDGDPDRPIIAGAINSAPAPGPVNADNQTESVIQTGGNNKIRMEDKKGSERIVLQSPESNSWFRIGATNDPIVIVDSSPYYVELNASYTDPGALTHPADDENNTSNIAFSEITDPSDSTTDSSGNPYTEVDTSIAGQWLVSYTSGNESAIRKVIVYDPADDDATVELSGTACDGIRIQSAGNLWTEAKSRYGEYYAGKPPAGPTKNQANVGDPSQIGDLIANFGDSYNPTGLKSHSSESDISFSDAIAGGHVHVSSLDTFTTQEGNIYDFGGYWNYNLGNSYAEDHIRQDAVLNTSHTVSFPADGIGFNLEGLASQVPILVTALVGTVVGSIAGAAAGGKGGAATVAGGGAAFAAIAFVVGTGVSAAAQGIGIAARGTKTLDDLVTSPGGDTPIETWSEAVKASEIQEDNGVPKLVQLDTAMVPGTNPTQPAILTSTCTGELTKKPNLTARGL
jgi:type VI secretion system VgrG family protein